MILNARNDERKLEVLRQKTNYSRFSSFPAFENNATTNVHNPYLRRLLPFYDYYPFYDR